MNEHDSETLAGMSFVHQTERTLKEKMQTLFQLQYEKDKAFFGTLGQLKRKDGAERKLYCLRVWLYDAATAY